jgi:hypothetical protein
LGRNIIIAPNWQTQDHTALYEPSFLGADPWSLGLTLTCEPAKFELCQGTWDQQTVHRARRREGRPWTDPLWSNWSWTLCATRVRVKPGETYRQPQMQFRMILICNATCGCVDNFKKLQAASNKRLTAGEG